MIHWLPDRPLLEWIVVGLALTAAGGIGGLFAYQMRNSGWPWWCGLISGTLGSCIWVYQANASKTNLMVASVFYDVIINTAFVAMLVLMGQPFKLVTAIGVILATLGVILVGL
jgi:drug/metabolite transporter (DMT)-like permease